jgi:hypothetical protein
VKSPRSGRDGVVLTASGRDSTTRCPHCIE